MSRHAFSSNQHLDYSAAEFTSSNGRSNVFSIQEALIRWPYRVMVGSPSLMIIEDLAMLRPSSSLSSEVERALQLYRMGEVSFGKAAELSLLNYDEMMEEVKRRGLALSFGPKTLQEAEEEEQVLKEYLRRLRAESKRSS